MKISFITTVFNEEKTIEKFLKSLFLQTSLPDEVIIVDGGSRDDTVRTIKHFITTLDKRKFNKVTIKVKVKAGNRSIGRNEAINMAKGDIILCSDAGNVLDKNWSKNITKPFVDPTVDVVAGYYRSKAKNVFQKALTPFALVMEDKVDPNTFLPATRSVAFTKKIWKKVGGFNENFSHNEDYVFARALRDVHAKIVFQKNAVVEWIPRNTYKEAFIMFFRFALGDSEAGILRFKVFLIFTKYFLLFYFLLLLALYRSKIGIVVFIVVSFLYLFYVVFKNYKYVKVKEAIVPLINLQFVSDFAVIIGTIMGRIKVLKHASLTSFISRNIFLIGVTILYSCVMLLSLRYGLPNLGHPFPYNMDEWHQLQAVRATVKFGTPNISGSANGTMLYFMLAAGYLAPFTVFHYINPVVLKVSDLVMRERIFELLRINTLIYSIFTLIVFDSISRILGLSRKFSIVLFVVTPIWLFISGFFKYDIAILLFAELTFYFLLRFSYRPTKENFIYASIVAGLAFAVKVSAIPLLPLLVLSFILFYPKWYKHISFLVTSLIVYFVTLLLFGTPDILFMRGNFFKYFYENVVTSPMSTDNFNLGMNAYLFLLLKQFPDIYGFGLMSIFALSLLLLVIYIFKNGITKMALEKKQYLLVICAFALLYGSLFTLKIFGGGNRSIMLLPFIVLTITIAFKTIQKNNILRKIVFIVIPLLLIIQMLQTYAWLSTKLAISPQVRSTEWIVKNIPEKSLIGIEPSPIYQQEPELIEKEYYFQVYGIHAPSKYSYVILDVTVKKLPKYVVVTNGEIDEKIYKKSDTKSLMQRLHKEGYTRIAFFQPNFRYYKYFGSDITYYLSYIMSAPWGISVYKKQ